MTTLFEEMFNTSALSIHVPEAGFELTSNPDEVDACLETLKFPSVERNVAFFDEKLEYLLLMHLDHTSAQPADAFHPPADLLSFLSHIQISFDASYIAPQAATPHLSLNSPINPARLSAPPRTTSVGRLSLKPRPSPLSTNSSSQPTMFPPHTPNPMPSTAEGDRRYVQSEGTLLLSGIWGENPAPDSPDTFSLLWSPKDNAWIAAYKLSLTVSFLRMNFAEPLLCLTVSATLREKPLPMTKARQPLADLIAASGASSASPTSPVANGAEGDDQDDGDIDLQGLDEVNLLEGLSSGPSFRAQGADGIFLPSSRLGPNTRQQAFSIHSPHSPGSPQSLSSPIVTRQQQPVHPTLRKSFRRTLQTVSGFRVRMRTVFVPYVLMNELDKAGKGQKRREEEEDEEERDRREAGNEERTVVLCVEVDNSGESGMGFAVEDVEVSISGEGARATLISWGSAFAGKSLFPLLVGAREQYNLLYAVSFWQSPEADDLTSLVMEQSEARKKAELQRAVAINIFGRPFESGDGGEEGEENLDPKKLKYPTRTFSSRWNCVLDLSPNRYRDSAELAGVDLASIGKQDALPTPASPFPQAAQLGTPKTSGVSTPPQTAKEMSAVQQLRSQAIAGSKRHTLAAIMPNLSPKPRPTPVNYRSSTSMLNPAFQRDSLVVPPTASINLQTPGGGGATPKLAYTPPSITVQQTYPHSPTTFAPRTAQSPPLPPPPHSGGSSSSSDQFAQQQQFAVVPPTPAYPSYPPASPMPRTPFSSVPLAQGGASGPSVDIRRERGAGMGAGMIPPTPGPRLMGGGFDPRMMAGTGTGMAVNAGMSPNMMQSLQDLSLQGGEPIVVSIGLLPLPRHDEEKENGKEKGKGREEGKIYPLDRFTLDIFVFNQSSWIRRLEVSYPDRRRRRAVASGGGGNDYFAGAVIPEWARKDRAQGILPLENRVRVGPLRPSTCQSVRMEFLALSPGVHSIDTLTLTDIEYGISTNLRSVMDIVVHEPNDA